MEEGEPIEGAEAMESEVEQAFSLVSSAVLCFIYVLILVLFFLFVESWLMFLLDCMAIFTFFSMVGNSRGRGLYYRRAEAAKRTACNKEYYDKI